MTSEPSTVSTVVQGSVSVAAIAFLQSALTHMIPYAICAVPLIILDLLWGIRAAKYRKERVTFSRAFRRTMSKVAEYLCWIIIAASIAIAFDMRWIEFVIIGAVMFNEIMSVVSNYLETKDIKLSSLGIFRWLFKTASCKVGVEVSREEIEEILQEKPKRKRNSKGQFVKKED